MSRKPSAVVAFGVAAVLICTATCGLGLVGLFPYFAVLSAVIYLLATGQPPTRQPTQSRQSLAPPKPGDPDSPATGDPGVTGRAT